MFRDFLRRHLGLDAIPRMEHHMASIIESLRELAAQQTEASAAQQASFSNLQGAIQRLEQAVRDGQVSPEVEQAVADLKAGFDTMREAANRADDGYEPAPVEPTEPQVPGDEEPTVPGEETPAEGDTGSTSRRR